MRSALALLLVSAFATGCGLIDRDGLFTGDDECAGISCGPCAPALTVRVKDPAGEPVSGVSIPGYASECGEGGDATVCSFGDSEGEYHFEVTAPGFRSQHVTATVPSSPRTGCCSCGYEPATADVVLQPE